MMTREIIATPLDHTAAWRGDAIAQRDDWRMPIGADEIAEIEAAVNGHAATGDAFYALSRQDFEMPSVAARMADIRCQVEDGYGFVLVQGLPVTRWGDDFTRRALWAIGCELGWAEGQDRDGRLIHDVRDTGKAFGSNDTIRYFQTSQAIEFHNDGADIFALLCLRDGVAGGKSRLVSAVCAFNTILERQPELAQVLQENFHVDARGQRTDGATCQVAPVFSYLDGQLNVLYKYAYVQSAQRFDDVPRLSSKQTEALNLLNEVMDEPGMALEFHLEPGDVLIASNHTLLHGRTSFEDSGKGPGRHMLRLWLSLPNGHKLPPHYQDTREFAATYRRRISASPNWD